MIDSEQIRVLPARIGVTHNRAYLDHQLFRGRYFFCRKRHWAVVAICSGLNPIQLRVGAALGNEFLVAAEFSDTRAVQHHDEIGHADGAEAMRDQQRNSAPGAICGVSDRAAPRDRGVTLKQRMLGLRVQGRGWLVKNQQQRVSLA